LIFDWRKGGKPLATTSAHSDKVLEVAAHPSHPTKFVTAGVKHVKFWQFTPDINTLDARKGVFGQKGEIQTVPSLAFFNNDLLVTGCKNGDLYLWDVEKRTVVDIVEKAHNGAVFAVATYGGLGVLSGGKDSGLVKTTIKDGKFDTSKQIFYDPNNDSSIRAISWRGDRVVFGYGDSSITMLSNLNGKLLPRRLLEAHDTSGNAEVWGLAAHPSRPECVTASEDMRVIRWNLERCCPFASLRLDRKLRSCAYHPSGEWIAVGADTDDVFILNAEELVPIYEIHEDGGRTTSADHPVKFSPDGKYLAVGGMRDDNGIAIYEAGTWKLVGVCSGHSSRVVSFDWSSDSRYLQSNSLELELLFWEIPSCTQVTKASDLSDQDWATLELPMAWPTSGVWKPGMNARDINTVSRNRGRTLLASGNDFSELELYTYPCYGDNAPAKKYFGHSSHVTKVAFSADDRWLLTVGGLDGTLIQWEVHQDNVH
jgi:microtubule-associated protein-like 1/2